MDTGLCPETTIDDRRGGRPGGWTRNTRNKPCKHWFFCARTRNITCNKPQQPATFAKNRKNRMGRTAFVLPLVLSWPEKSNKS